MITREFVQAIPKTDLHVHLDGSLRVPTLIELAKSRKVALPSQTVTGLMETVFKKQYKDLPEYLQGFGLTCAVMQDPESLERVAYEFALDNAAEGVRYVEVRFAPQLHINDNLDMETVLVSVNKGMERAKKEINAASTDPDMPPFEYGIIACNLRFFLAQSSPYYAKFMEAHAFSKPKEIYALASQELARAMVEIRDDSGIPIVGLDLAGAEAGWPADDHAGAYEYVHKHFMKKTVHAGEAYGAESIFQAITDLHADRIGHGYQLFDRDAIKDPEIKDPDDYIKKLTEFIADRRITIEVCLTSNMQTNPNLHDIRKHTFGEMMRRNLSVTLCTDNRLVSRTTVTDEILLALNNFPITPPALKNIIIYGFKRSFFPGSYTEKRAYVHKVIDYYEKVCARYENNQK